jgi:hypothetical protein
MTTLSYKLDVLTVASENAKESIGAGLVDALARAGGGSEVKDATKAINNIAVAINGVSLAVGTAIGGLVKLYSLVEKVTTLGGIFDYKRYQKNPSSVGSSVDLIESARSNKAVSKALATQTKATKALTAEQKKQASLKKSSLIFDMEQTQLIAALKGKLTEEEANRVKALLALENNNATAAKYYTDLVLNAQDATGKLAQLIRNLPTAANPFANWTVPASMTPTATAASGSQYVGSFVDQVRGIGAYAPTAPTTVINVAGSVVSEQGLIDAVRGGLNVASLSGSGSTVRRIGGF